MKKTLSIILICIMILSLSAFIFTSCTSLGSVEMVDNYESIDDLIKDSPIIVIGTVDSDNNEFIWGEVPFALTKFKIETTIRGTVSDTINILQTKTHEDPFLRRGDRMILFLTQYEGSITEDAYVLKGLYQGQYTIEGTRVIKNKDNKLTGDEVLGSIDALISKINVLGYITNPATSTSQE